jgi:DNA-directed RNA polymerase subunit M/transcription elongation factor TFIIS
MRFAEKILNLVQGEGTIGMCPKCQYNITASDETVMVMGDGRATEGYKCGNCRETWMFSEIQGNA